VSRARAAAFRQLNMLRPAQAINSRLGRWPSARRERPIRVKASGRFFGRQWIRPPRWEAQAQGLAHTGGARLIEGGYEALCPGTAAVCEPLARPSMRSVPLARPRTGSADAAQGGEMLLLSERNH
jgi:hypothetical protein